MNSNDRDEARREHIRSEQRREARKADEAYDARHREIDAGFSGLDAADRDIERARLGIHDSRSSQAVRDIIRCEADIDDLLRKLMTLPDESDYPFSLFLSGSNADIRRKTQEWSERFSEIRLTSEFETKITMKRIRELQEDIDRYRDCPRSLEAHFFTAPVSADAQDLLLKLWSKLLWLDQYYTELEWA